MDRPRIAIACRQVAGVTGTTTGILEHCRRLSALGWAVDVYGERLDEERVRAAGAAPRRLWRLPWGGYAKRALFSWLFDRAAARGGYDLLWGHGDTLRQDVLSLHNCVHAAHEAVRGRPAPEAGVARLHGRILRERRFKLLIANSELMRREVVSRFGVPEDSVVVVRPGYDEGRFRAEDKARLRGPARRELGVGEGELLVGLITSGDFLKRGVGTFLSALARLPQGLRERLRALVVGRESRLGPYRRAAELALPGRVIFREPRPDVAPMYHALDLYVHPALYEEFGQSVQEAMACGVPALTSARVGASELLREGALAAPDELPLAEGMRALLSDEALRARRAAEGLAACRANTWETNFRATLACLERLLYK